MVSTFPENISEQRVGCSDGFAGTSGGNEGGYFTDSARQQTAAEIKE